LLFFILYKIIKYNINSPYKINNCNHFLRRQECNKKGPPEVRLFLLMSKTKLHGLFHKIPRLDDATGAPPPRVESTQKCLIDMIPRLSIASPVVAPIDASPVAQLSLQAAKPPSTKRDQVTKKRVQAKASPKRCWDEFKRQASRRGLNVSISERRYSTMINSKCTYCETSRQVGVDRARNKEHYTAENNVPCCGSCNMAKRSDSIRDFALRAIRITKALRPVFSFAPELKRSNSI
jgi:hypothetical protein